MTKKSLGQHWLSNPQILQKIVDSGDISAQDTVLEIGPGQGTLTLQLAETGAKIIALEFDQDLISPLQEKFANQSNVQIQSGDIRKFNFSQLPPNYKIIANIPYYLTSNLIRILTELDNQPQIAVLLVQKEVARRIVAGPGQASLLSNVAQYGFLCSLGVEVGKQYFQPPPKVDSQVVILQKRSKPPLEVDFQDFSRVLRAGFSQKRKKISNSLAAGLKLSKSEVDDLLQQAKISAAARPQHLSLEEWGRLTAAFIQQKTH